MNLLRLHARRLGLWSALGTVAGLAVWFGLQDPASQAFGFTTVIWCLVNFGFVAGAWHGKPPEQTKLERLLWLNQGLNLGYVGVGVTMAFLAGPWSGVFGAGIAVVIQGFGLLVLDGWLLRNLTQAQG